MYDNYQEVNVKQQVIDLKQTSNNK